MWEPGWRDRVWSQCDQRWDLIIIGGGITGAGILREAVRAGLKTLLVEQHDFASGTSSRSSKLVHGGFRYLKNGQIKLTFESVHERERLLKEGRGLINQLGFLMPGYRGDRMPTWIMGLGLTIYDLLALKWGHRYYDAYDLRELCPLLSEDGLRGGYRFFDAQTDDARLVLRLIREGVLEGGCALNYARVTGLLTASSPGCPAGVCGIRLEDQAHFDPTTGLPAASPRTLEIQAGLVVNATGAWVDELRRQVGAPPRLRKLRGSHLVLPQSRLPLTRAISLWHPQDHRPVFAFPWEGVTILGTTDIDYQRPPETDPAISQQEVDYLLAAAHFAFPEQNLQVEDIQATFSGIRPVVDTGKADPSKESREHVLWQENSLLTVSGGKLTTFRLIARDVLRATRAQLPAHTRFDPNFRVLAEPDLEGLQQAPLSRAARLRLAGRYGLDAARFLRDACPEELQPIGSSTWLWAELRWAARQEAVTHLDDLLLRRVRLGLTLPRGGLDQLDAIRKILQPELGWSDARWGAEVNSYTNLWQRCYHFPSSV